MSRIFIVRRQLRICYESNITGEGWGGGKRRWIRMIFLRQKPISRLACSYSSCVSLWGWWNAETMSFPFVESWKVFASNTLLRLIAAIWNFGGDSISPDVCSRDASAVEWHSLELTRIPIDIWRRDGYLLPTLVHLFSKFSIDMWMSTTTTWLDVRQFLMNFVGTDWKGREDGWFEIFVYNTRYDKTENRQRKISDAFIWHYLHSGDNSYFVHNPSSRISSRKQFCFIFHIELEILGLMIYPWMKLHLLPFNLIEKNRNGFIFVHSSPGPCAHFGLNPTQN